eukprot:gene13278-29946_t
MRLNFDDDDDDDDEGGHAHAEAKHMKDYCGDDILRWPVRVKGIARHIRERSPDVIGLCEVAPHQRNGLWSSLYASEVYDGDDATIRQWLDLLILVRRSKFEVATSK